MRRLTAFWAGCGYDPRFAGVYAQSIPVADRDLCNDGFDIVFFIVVDKRCDDAAIDTCIKICGDFRTVTESYLAGVKFRVVVWSVVDSAHFSSN